MTVREAIEAGDLDTFAEVLAPDVVWVGLLPRQLCRNRAEVVEMLGQASRLGVRASPEIVLTGDDMLVVDPHLEPTPAGEPERHHLLVLREDGLVSEVRVYPNRSAAVAAARAE